MNTDFYYEIGHSHISCQDYALAGKINADSCFAIVSDGCSSSDDVDVGARIISHSAKSFLCNEYAKNIDAFKNLKSSEFCVPIIASAHNVMKSLCMDQYSLDATLLMSISDGKETRIFAYGDGCIVIKKKDGSIKFIKIEYNDGAPYYLSYSLDSKRKEDYLREFTKGVRIHEGEIVDGKIVLQPFDKLHDIDGIYDIATWTMTDVEMITLISDGVNTYEKLIDGKPLEKIDMDRAIEGISKYKNFHGKFVERRMRNFRKECLKENIGHYDDIGVASIYIGK